LFVLHQTAKRQ